jgi:hypothetical protein
MYSRFTIDNTGADSEQIWIPPPHDDVYEPPVCPPGTRVFRQRCLRCSPGSYSDTASASTCTFCTGNTIAAFPGSTSCTECPEGYTAIQRTRCDPPSQPTNTPVLPPMPALSPLCPPLPTPKHPPTIPSDPQP